MKTIFILLFVLLFIDGRAQEIEDVTAVQEGNSILVSYSLVDSSVTPDFNVSLYCSGDGGTSWQGPLIYVSGDIGTNVLAVNTNQIRWDVLKEWDYLYGENIKFRIDARLREKTEFIGDSMIIDLRDSSIYKVVTIGDNIWMAENLRIKTKTGSDCYDHKPENCIKYGRLYNWETATKVCPDGWHLSTHDEMIELVDIAIAMCNRGGLSATKLKSVEGWIEIKVKKGFSKRKMSPDNQTGFNALPAGYLQYYHYFRGGNASFWTSTEYSDKYPYYMGMINAHHTAYIPHSLDKSHKLSVRCVKDKQE